MIEETDLLGGDIDGASAGVHDVDFVGAGEQEDDSGGGTGPGLDLAQAEDHCSFERVQHLKHRTTQQMTASIDNIRATLEW